MLGIEKFRVNVVGGEVVTADNEDFRRHISEVVSVIKRCKTTKKKKLPRRWWLGGFDFAEQLSEDPEKVVVVGAPEDLGDESATFHEKFHCEPETHEDELCLGVGVLDPGSTDVGCTVMENNISFPVLELVSNEVATAGCGDVCGESGDTGNGTDRDEIDANNDAIYWHRLARNLEPTTGGSTEIDTAARRFQKAIFLV
jgi:hypothetical protein